MGASWLVSIATAESDNGWRWRNLPSHNTWNSQMPDPTGEGCCALDNRLRFFEIKFQVVGKWTESTL